MAWWRNNCSLRTARLEGGTFLAISRAYSRVDANSSSFGKTRWTMPRRRASSESNFRPDRIRSMATPMPTMFGSIRLTPISAINPRLAKAVVKVTPLAAKRMSQFIICENPPPATAPWMQAMMGFGITNACVVSRPLLSNRMPVFLGSLDGNCCCCCCCCGCGCLPGAPCWPDGFRDPGSRVTSAPAHQARPFPVITMTRHSGSPAARSYASSQAPESSSVHVFKLSGLFRVSSATPSSHS
mmetsp:Transcript_87409/g.260763  ORF Transcript_87409/g.260763 Transcript_87409/m.260763 type:complete len:241 (+) Transcript_87409:220-942(+)